MLRTKGPSLGVIFISSKMMALLDQGKKKYVLDVCVTVHH